MRCLRGQRRAGLNTATNILAVATETVVTVATNCDQALLNHRLQTEEIYATNYFPNFEPKRGLAVTPNHHRGPLKSQMQAAIFPGQASHVSSTVIRHGRFTVSEFELVVYIVFLLYSCMLSLVFSVRCCCSKGTSCQFIWGFLPFLSTNPIN